MSAATAPTIAGTRGRPLEDEGRRGQTAKDMITQWAREGAVERIATGWPTFDEATRGGIPVGALTMLLGAPNASKTAALACFADRCVRDGIAVGVLAVDEDASDFLVRLAVMAGVSLDEAERRDAATLRRLDKMIGALPIRLYGLEWTVEDAAADFDAWRKRQGMKRAVFMADSVQTITCDASLDASSLRAFVGANATALKRAAARHQIAVISTGEIARSHYSGRSGDDMQAGKEAGSLEYYARIQIVLRRVKGHETLIRATVPKIKRGLKDEAVFFLRFDRARHALTEEIDATKPDATEHTRKAILKAIAERGKAELGSATAIAKAAKANYQRALTVAKQMIAAGDLVKLDGSYRPKTETA